MPAVWLTPCSLAFSAATNVASFESSCDRLASISSSPLPSASAALRHAIGQFLAPAWIASRLSLVHGGASVVGGAAELGMEALIEATRSANKGTVRENIVPLTNHRRTGCPGYLGTADIG